MTPVNLVLIETCGNQAFIFSTNKLRENVGASELTARAGTGFVLDSIKDAGGPDLSGTTMANLSNRLVSSASNPPIEAPGSCVEVVLAASGKALLVVRNENIGKRIIQNVTLRALREAPGLEVRGVVGGTFDFDRGSIHSKVSEIHAQFETIRSRLPGPATRFLRLPMVASCSSSGLPASGSGITGPGDSETLSAVVLAKRAAAVKGLERIKALASGHRIPPSIDLLDNLGCEWLGIVHADGNGLGQIFLDFERMSATQGNNRGYIDALRRFSLALDKCTEQAFRESLDGFTCPSEFTPVVPLVLGGDDLTVVCDGRQALRFTNRFISRFETLTKGDPAIRAVNHGKGLTSCAGVAIVKPHFPFHAGYQLAEELLRVAKKWKPASAIDFHILYDSSGPDLERIRKELTVGNAHLVARPYTIHAQGGHVGRSWSDLSRRVSAVNARDHVEGRRLLPNSMLHELRESLFEGRESAEARLNLFRSRYMSCGIGGLLENDRLFWRVQAESYVTGLLDAVDTAEFWEGGFEDANEELQ